MFSGLLHRMLMLGANLSKLYLSVVDFSPTKHKSISYIYIGKTLNGNLVMDSLSASCLFTPCSLLKSSPVWSVFSRP